MIAGTGYRTSLGPILGPLGLLDERSLPTVGALGDARRAPGLYSVGMDIPLSGLLREIGFDARRLVGAMNRSRT